MTGCPLQEVCQHYTNGTKRRVHHIRITEPCKHYLACDCKVMVAIAELETYALGKEHACSINKRRRK